jgi:hypothetical protein
MSSRTGSQPLELDELDAQLLRELRRRWPTDVFDEINISTAAPSSPQLLDALAFLGVRINRRRRSLTEQSVAVVEQWIKRVDRVPIAGLQLKRDCVGWCEIKGVTGATGPAG